MFEAIDIAGSGASVDQTWIDTIGEMEALA